MRHRTATSEKQTDQGSARRERAGSHRTQGGMHLWRHIGSCCRRTITLTLWTPSRRMTIARRSSNSCFSNEKRIANYGMAAGSWLQLWPASYPFRDLVGPVTDGARLPGLIVACRPRSRRSLGLERTGCFSAGLPISDVAFGVVDVCFQPEVDCRLSECVVN